MQDAIKYLLVMTALTLIQPAFADDSSRRTIIDQHIDSYRQSQTKPSFNYYYYVDTSYNYLVRSNKFTSGAFNRLFDIEENGFTLNQVGGSMSYTPDNGLGALVRIIAGVDANRVAPSGWDPYYGSETLAWYPYDAYLQYAYHNLTVMAGALDTLIGLESNESDEDLNFSRSILAYAQPGTNIGMRAEYQVTPTVQLDLGLSNGIATFRNAGQLDEIDYAITYKPVKQFNFAFHGSTGSHFVTPGAVKGPTSEFTILDVVSKYSVTEDLALELNADYYTQHKGLNAAGGTNMVVWKGVAGYIAYNLADQWRIAARGEVFDDADGFAFGVQQTWREATLTLQYKPRDDIIFRAETRRDFSNVNSFVSSSGVSTARNQQSFALEGIYVVR